MATTASRSRLGKVDAVIAGALCLGLGVGLVELGKLALDWPVPCQLALEKARCSALVQECIGGNIKSSLLWDGNIQIDRITARIPVFGSSGSGTLYIAAIRVGKDWTLLQVELHIDVAVDNLTAPTVVMYDLLTEHRIADSEIYCRSNKASKEP
jgi:hypothetical protein